MAERSVLIVSNNSGLVPPLRVACMKAGFGVMVSPDGLHAVMQALQKRPDVLVMDGANGTIEPCYVSELLRGDGRTATILTILLVDGVDRNIVQLCRAAHVRMLLKQADYSHAVARIRSLLAQRRHDPVLGANALWPNGSTPPPKNARPAA